ncbi:hypothetical protein EG329_002485 [Mollisiaceae sp. DMI_Dod_QoI]|nr:hypothetical protein EG329_002485 [Helotiales sp. DMI_Dod_QoI]
MRRGYRARMDPAQPEAVCCPAEPVASPESSQKTGHGNLTMGRRYLYQSSGSHRAESSSFYDGYRNAKGILAWLGPAANDSDAYFDYLNYLEAGVDITGNVQAKLSAARSEASMFTLDEVDGYEVDGYEDYISNISIHRYDVLDGQRETLEELLYRYSNSECSDLRDRVFSLLVMASDCEGFESTLVDYNLSIPALFFSLIARFEPLDVASFSTILQDTLGVRRVQLMKYWDAVAADSHITASSPMEELSFNYIRKVDSYGKSQESSHLSQSSLWNPQILEFIVQSYLAAQRPELLDKKDKLFRIGGTKLWLQFKHTLFGLHFVDVLVNNDDAQDHESDILCFFDLTPTGEQEEQMWKSMLLLANMLERDNKNLVDHDMIREWKETTTRNYGADIAEPDIEIICSTLQQFASREEFIMSRLCLVDCRYVVSSLYGYSLLRPSDVFMRGEDFVVGDTD